MRSGTENTAGIAAFAAAVDEGVARFDERRAAVGELCEHALAALAGRVPEAHVNKPQTALAGIISVTPPDIRSETALNFLSERGIFVSAGSACSARSGMASGVLRAFGLSEREADQTIRVSLGHENTRGEIDSFVDALAEAVATLQRAKR